MYYIVDLRKPKKPKLLWNVFTRKSKAVEAIIKYLGYDTQRFYPIKGREAIENGVTTFVLKHSYRYPGDIHYVKILKYDYPPNRLTLQKKKTFRTSARRKQRKLNAIKSI